MKSTGELSLTVFEEREVLKERVDCLVLLAFS